MTYKLDGIVLPEELLWRDEFDWSVSVQQQTRTISGALLVEESTTTAGRPISLVSSYGSAIVSRVDLQALKAKEDQPGLVMELTVFDGRRFSVVWRRDPQGIEATPFIEFVNPGDSAPYEINLNFTVIEELS
jgi:hypothetical protein